MNNADGTPVRDAVSAYRTSEPSRSRDPFVNPALRSELARIAEVRAKRAASGWRSTLFGWVSAAPRGALTSAALAVVLLIGGAAGPLAGAGESSARMNTGNVPLASGALPLASSDVKISGAESELHESGEIEGLTLVTTAALVLLTGSLAVVFVTVRRRRA